MTLQCKDFIPWIVLSIIGIAVPIICGASYALVLVIYGLVCIGNSIGCALFGWYINQGFFPAYVTTKRRLDGHCAIVTGANSGVGYETAKELVSRGCHVIITCRSQAKVDATIKSIYSQLGQKITRQEAKIVAKKTLQQKKQISSKVNKEDVAPINRNINVDMSDNNDETLGQISFLILDLSIKESIDNALNKLFSMNVNVNILINNAGIWFGTSDTREKFLTNDLIESTWQTNYFGPFYFTQRLLKHIINSSKRLNFGRIINVTSAMSKLATNGQINAFLDDNLRSDEEYWSKQDSLMSYCNTKCVQIMHSRKLQNILNQMQFENENKNENKSENENENESDKKVGDVVYSMCIHPGFVDTGFLQKRKRNCAISVFTKLEVPFLNLFCMLTVEQGAQTTLHCVLEPNGSKKLNPGGYHAHCQPKQLINRVQRIVNDKMEQMYQVSNDLSNQWMQQQQV